MTNFEELGDIVGYDHEVDPEHEDHLRRVFGDKRIEEEAGKEASGLATLEFVNTVTAICDEDSMPEADNRWGIVPVFEGNQTRLISMHVTSGNLGRPADPVSNSLATVWKLHGEPMKFLLPYNEHDIPTGWSTFEEDLFVDPHNGLAMIERRIIAGLVLGKRKILTAQKPATEETVRQVTETVQLGFLNRSPIPFGQLLANAGS
jgi:hypothetical protein